MPFQFLRNRRRRRWLAQREPSDWTDWLRKNVWQYHHLDPDQRRRVHDFVCVLFHEKYWTGGADLQVTDEMRVAIAGQAALVTLGFEKPYYFDRLQTIIVYPGHFQGRPASTDKLLLGKFSESLIGFGTRSGESWQGGPIILAWEAVHREGRNQRIGRNVVLHEFAHHMDGLDGETNGAPPITDYEFEKRWYRVTDAEFGRLLRFARQGQTTVLDHYGAENHAEFFAVATECFFTRPHNLAAQWSDLYAALTRLFGQDPRTWLPAGNFNLKQVGQ